MKDAVSEWDRYCRRNYSELTAYNYHRIVEMFRYWTGGNKQVNEITVDDLERWLDAMLKQHKRNSVNTLLCAIKSFYKYISERRGVANIAALVRTLKREPWSQRFLTDEEYYKVVHLVDGVHRDVIMFLANTGLRRAEFRHLEPRDIAADRASLTVRKGKGGKQRVVPMNPIVRDIIERSYDHTTERFRWTARYGSYCAVYRLCLTLANRAHIQPFGPHSLRHFFATALIRRGVPLKKVSLILGHSSIAVTERVYCHLLPGDLMGVTDCLTDCATSYLV